MTVKFKKFDFAIFIAATLLVGFFMGVHFTERGYKLEIKTLAKDTEERQAKTFKTKSLLEEYEQRIKVLEARKKQSPVEQKLSTSENAVEEIKK